MRNSYIFILVLLSCQLSFAQLEDKQEIYTTHLKKELAKFEKNKRVLGNKYLDEKVDKVFKTVVFSNSDITTTGSSVSIVQGSDKASLTAAIINPLTTLGARQLFLRAGIYAKGKDDIFNLYSDESWKNEIGLNASLILKPAGSVFYDKTETAAIREKRILFADSIRAEKYKYFTQENIKIIQQRKILAKIIEIRTKWVKDGATSEYPTYKSIESKFEEELPDDNTITKCRNLIPCPESTGCLDGLDCITLPDYRGLIKDIQKKGLSKVKDSIEKVYQKINMLENKNKANIKKMVNDELYEFDKKYDITKGYRLHWFEVSGSVGNSSLNIPNDSILAESALDIEKIESNLKASVGASYNFAHNYRYLIFGQFGINTNIGDYLDSNLFQGTPNLRLNDEAVYIFNEDQDTLGLYKNLNKSFSTADLYGYLSIFITKKKNIGFFISVKHNALINKPESTYFVNNYSAIAGPLFRQVDNENCTKAVFGIEIGYENAPYEVKAKDFFIARAKVGIPFNIYDKTTKK